MAIAQIIQPAPAEGAQQLFLLFPDAGSSVERLAPLAEALRAAFPEAAIVGLLGPHHLGDGGSWLTDPAIEHEAPAIAVPSVDQETLDAAVAHALPGAIGSIRAWQAQMKVLPEATALIGQGEGATLALAAALSSVEDGHPVCGRVSVVGGRFASLPAELPPMLMLHLVHGKADLVNHFSHSVRTAEALVKRNADVVADIVPHETDELSAELQDWLLNRLQTRIPRHIWEAAMKVEGDSGCADEDGSLN